MTDRRTWLMSSLGLLVTGLPARAQSPREAFRVAILARSTDGVAARLWEVFIDGLRELGHVEGQNLVIERRPYGDSNERLSALAAELARLPIDAIVTGASPAPEAARRATPSIPIVMTAHADPVGAGLVASLARPGGNVTGLSTGGTELRGKQLQLLMEAVPGLRRVAVLANPDVPGKARDLRDVEDAARSLNVQIQVVEARAPDELSAAFATAARERTGAMLVLGSAMFSDQRAQLTELAARRRLPAMYGFREFAEAGGLIAYGLAVPYNFRRAAWYVDRILKGTKPMDLPVEQPKTFELVINLKAAKALGLAIPRSVLGRADAVIE
jgi:putative tryptophan/tyrosine transport system substrate-binding protein